MGEKGSPAILISPEKDVSEITELARSAGYRIISTFTQKMKFPQSEFYIGEGKVKQISELLEKTGTRGKQGKPARDGRDAPPAAADPADVANDDEYDEPDTSTPPKKPSSLPEKPQLAIFNGTLKPTHTFHLEKAFGISVFDRIRLILEIFSKRANSPEARLQVEFARLQYDVPLVKEYIHRTRTGEHPGLFFAGGSYQVDDYYDMIKSRMARIRRELVRIGEERAQRRKTRRRGGQALIGLAGYTNAGKSALFKALCKEDAVVDDLMFSTLSTTTRQVKFPVAGAHILLTDTVGFIRNLPPWLIDAFRSTLEEVFLSDAILIVVDVADEYDEMLSKLETTLGILRKGECGAISTIVAFNKSDLLDWAEVERRVQKAAMRHELSSYCVVSAKTGDGLRELVELVVGSLGDFFFGTIDGPEHVVRRLEKDEGLAVQPGGRVLLRNWQVLNLTARHPELVFNRTGAPQSG